MGIVYLAQHKENGKCYEGKSITVEGTFTGPGSYDTAVGSSRTVPFVEDAKVV